MLRLIGVGAGVGQERIAVTSAATAGGHRLALLHGLKAAGAHSGSDVLAAILTRASPRGRRHRNIGQRQERRGGRRGQFQKLFHLALSVGFNPGTGHGIAVGPAPSVRKNSKAILSGARQTIESYQARLVLKDGHHSNESAPKLADGHEGLSVGLGAEGSNIRKVDSRYVRLRAYPGIDGPAQFAGSTLLLAPTRSPHSVPLVAFRK
jgi:hypothetical protein